MPERYGIKKRMARWLVYAAVMLVMILGTPLRTAAKTPSPNASVTKKNIMAVLKKYDPDGTFLLQKTSAETNYLIWWTGKETLTSGMNTAVHEQCHFYTHSLEDWYSDRIYIGSQKSILVPYTKVYRSSIMAKSIPKKLRTMRYDTYVGNPDPYLTAEQCGAYGLLDEFTAYNWGMHNTVCLYDYYSSFQPNPELWMHYLSTGGNDRLAYAEFKYYILRYLKYAKTHYPDVYKGILKNKKFVKAYTKIEKMFANNIRTYEKSLTKLEKLLQKKGYETMITDDFYYIDGYGTGIFEKDYRMLQKELKKYASIEKALKAAI